MDFDQYVAARHGRLVEHAVLLGCAEAEAGAYVDQVLHEQRKRIRRAEDPDPLVRDALERAISGAPEKSRRTGPLVAVGLVAVAVAVGAVATYRPTPDPLPSLFALTGDQAEQLLESQGYDVSLEQARSCEPPGLVVDSDPPSGAPVREGRHRHGPHLGAVGQPLRARVSRGGWPPGSSCSSRWAGARHPTSPARWTWSSTAAPPSG